MTAPDVPVHLLLGDESLLVSEAEQATVRAVFGEAGPGFNLATFQAGEGAAGALALARTLPMMARRRVVVIREMENAKVVLLDELLAYVDNPNPSTVLAPQPPPQGRGRRHRSRRPWALVRRAPSPPSEPPRALPNLRRALSHPRPEARPRPAPWCGPLENVCGLDPSVSEAPPPAARRRLGRLPA